MKTDGKTPGTKPEPTPEPDTPKEPTEAEKAQAWRTKYFQPLRNAFSFRSFEKISAEKISTLQLSLKEMPAQLGPEIQNWFFDQKNQIPSEVWARSQWRKKKEEAEKITRWCTAATTLLDFVNNSFGSLKKELESEKARFAPVLGWKGAITLTLHIWPYAELVSLKSGEEWIVQEGKRVSSKDGIKGDHLATPLVIDQIPGGEIELSLKHPDHGTQKITFKADRFGEGKSYLFGGTLQDPKSLTLQELP